MFYGHFCAQCRLNGPGVSISYYMLRITITLILSDLKEVTNLDLYDDTDNQGELELIHVDS